MDPSSQECEVFQRLIWKAFDGEAESGEQQRLHRHLAHCGPCREAEAQAGREARSIETALREIADGAFGPSLVEQVGRALRSEPHPRLVGRTKGPETVMGRRQKTLAGLGIVATAAALLLLFILPSGGGEAPLGRIIGAGEVRISGRISSRMSSRGSVAEQSRSISAGDTLVVSRDAPATIKLARGARIEMAAGSEASIDVLAGDGRFTATLKAGSLVADVDPGGELFVIRSRDAEVTVLGTRFAVEIVAAGGTRLRVERGKVRYFHLPGGPARVVNAGEVYPPVMTTLPEIKEPPATAPQPPAAPKPVSPDRKPAAKAPAKQPALEGLDMPTQRP